MDKSFIDENGEYNVDVVSIAEWNENDTYGKYPFRKLQGQIGK